ncbi:MAG TPA: aminotransferase class V-fold PLP-dependent enzyme [Steroidobacteraceae bacterium]|nr:aminotransferase class V-fold PLP-dependent enzyme [Steroidobacteraceae bacterium]
MNGADDPIYLDYNATTPLLPEVVDAMLPYLREHFGNPSSRHLYGKRAHDAIERARSDVAALINSHADEIIFTSGGTEANNLAIRGTTALTTRRRVVTSVVEHPATARPVSWLEREGWDIVRIGVDAGGRSRVPELDAAITSVTALVTIMHSNNETGVFQPIQEAVRFARRAGACVHTDAAQSVGKVPIDVRAMDLDLLSIAGHKLYGPKGVGALFVRRGTDLEPLALGAGHERGLRPGTENVASIVGLGAACALARCDLDAQGTRVSTLRDRLWERLAQAIPQLALNGHVENRLPNTLNVRFPEISGEALLAATPQIAASTGSACHDGDESASAVLLAMGIPARAALGSVRLTLGRATTESAVDRAATALARAWRALAIK